MNNLWLDVAVTLVSMFVVGCYTWSLRGHFHSPRMPRAAKLISALVAVTTVLFAYLLWNHPQPPLPQWIGLGLQLASIAIFWWAVSASRAARLRFAFDEENPHSLVQGGPYRYVRHPFYTSYILFWTGWALATWTLWAVVPVLALIALYVVAARGEEAQFAQTDLSSDYANYRAATGFMLPKTFSAKRGA
jgi:protein-S-isoprenylcysteine O-methyltransferase Ste14